MDEDRTTKKFINAQPIGTRREGRPNLRWIDGIEKDLLVLKTRNWRTLAGRRLLENECQGALGYRATEEGRNDQVGQKLPI
ncbi:uncharacterized protein TNCV_5093571 [Trichonephila clavipes]|nr:uncharacterized protein TNCV_5093571 [Trichonephila clavipes]